MATEFLAHYGRYLAFAALAVVVLSVLKKMWAKATARRAPRRGALPALRVAGPGQPVQAALLEVWATGRKLNNAPAGGRNRHAPVDFTQADCFFALMSETYPVTVAVQRPDGSTEQVRVGTATKSADGFSLKLGELSIGGQPVAASSYGGGSRPAARPAGGGDGMVFPPYGRSKGMPISGATMQDLEFYANGSRRSLADPSKSRFHDKERVLLAAIEAEIARQQGGGGGGMGGPDDSGIPPPGDEDAPF